MNKIALTIDIEDWYHTPAVTGSNFSFYPSVKDFMNKWNKRYDYITKPTLFLLDFLKQRNLKATFFIVADIGVYYPGLIERIADDGHEIACHGLHHQIKINSKTKEPLLSVNEFEDKTHEARHILQKLSKQQIIGYRAPGAYFGEWMFESLINLGFKYDSSINPNSFFNKTDINLNNHNTKPYYYFGKNGNLLEIPWPSFSFFGLKFPTAGGPFLRFMPASYITKGLTDSLKSGDTVLYFHSLDIATEKIPSLASSNIKRPFYFNTSGTSTLKKLELILNKFNDNWTTCSSLSKKYSSE